MEIQFLGGIYVIIQDYLINTKRFLYLGKVMALRGSDGGGHYIGPSPKHLQKHLNRCRHDHVGIGSHLYIRV